MVHSCRRAESNVVRSVDAEELVEPHPFGVCVPSEEKNVMNRSPIIDVETRVHLTNYISWPLLSAAVFRLMIFFKIRLQKSRQPVAGFHGIEMILDLLFLLAFRFCFLFKLFPSVAFFP